MGAAALGIRNLLLLKGDDPKQGDQPDAKPVFDYDTAALTAVAVAMRDKGELPTGKKWRQGGFLHRRGRRADRSAGRLGAEEPQGQDRGGLRVRADPVLHGCRRGAALHGAACRARRDGCRS